MPTTSSQLIQVEISTCHRKFFFKLQFLIRSSSVIHKKLVASIPLKNIFFSLRKPPFLRSNFCKNVSPVSVHPLQSEVTAFHETGRAFLPIFGDWSASPGHTKEELFAAEKETEKEEEEAETITDQQDVAGSAVFKSIALKLPRRRGTAVKRGREFFD